MIIDYFKEQEFWETLKEHNTHLFSASIPFKYLAHQYETANDEVSEWFDPYTAKYKFVGRSFPFPHEASSKPDFKLCFTLSNYLPVFLIAKLYQDKKYILIEDIGAGDGKMEFYLSKLGFDNFHLIENFHDLPKKLLDANLKGVSYKLNNLSETFPTVITNNGSFIVSSDISPRWTPSIELAICFTHELFDCQEFTDRLEKWGYKFLCRDVDNLSIAFARHDKLNEFTEKLLPYAKNN